MRKAWVFKRKNVKGWWVGWYEANRRKAKAMPNKALAEQFARRLELQHNPDIYYDPIKVPWDHLVREYLEHKQFVERRADETIRDIKKTLKTFRQIAGPVVSTNIDQAVVNRFIRHRSKQVVAATVNKDIRNLKAIIKWAVKSRYMRVTIDWFMQKETTKPVAALSAIQLENLLIAARDYSEQWYILVLLAVTSGLRRRDVENLTWSNIDLETETITTTAKKTGKNLFNHPLHPATVKALTQYHANCTEGQSRIFTDRYHASKWNRIRKRAGLPGFKFKHLRPSCASFIAQAGFSTSVVQRILQHSTPALTAKHYINVDPVCRKAIASIPITIDAE